MLEFLQTGRMLYVLAAICALGTLSTLVTGSLYKRLIKETGNMALTKDKNLKALKQRMENVFLINHGIRNVNAYIEKQLYGFRFMHMSLDGWDNLVGAGDDPLLYGRRSGRRSVLTGIGVTTIILCSTGQRAFWRIVPRICGQRDRCRDKTETACGSFS